MKIEDFHFIRLIVKKYNKNQAGQIGKISLLALLDYTNYGFYQKVTSVLTPL